MIQTQVVEQHGTMEQATTLEAVLKRDRAIAIAGIAGVAALAWAYILYLASDMGRMMIPLTESWSAGDFIFQYVMWSVMMVAMMVPSAAPMVLMFATVNRRRREQQRPFVPTSVFLMGYVVVWSGFALAATLAQWGFHSAALLSPMMESTSAYLGAALVMGAGLFQFTPLKSACLTQCRTPLGFIMTEWRDGGRGALTMGLRHGAFCVGCCWVLMALLFVTGVMSLLWVAVIAGFILLEKVAPAGLRLSRLSGLTLVGFGLAILASELA